MFLGKLNLIVQFEKQIPLTCCTACGNWEWAILTVAFFWSCWCASNSWVIVGMVYCRSVCGSTVIAGRTVKRLPNR